MSGIREGLGGGERVWREVVGDVKEKGGEEGGRIKGWEGREW